MKIQVRKSEERGKAEYSWLRSYHTFSFDTYYDSNEMGFGSLRVINEDTVQAGRGFEKHGHRDMEIITYVVSGELTHQDSTGSKHVMKAGGVQKMSAGKGIHHSEMNEGSEPVHLFQMWIVPSRMDVTPSYVEYLPEEKDRKDQWQVLASNKKTDKVFLEADASILTTDLSGNKEIRYSLGAKRRAWVQVIQGEVRVDGQHLRQGDGARIWDAEELIIVAEDRGARVLLFDLA